MTIARTMMYMCRRFPSSSRVIRIGRKLPSGWGVAFVMTEAAGTSSWPGRRVTFRVRGGGAIFTAWTSARWRSQPIHRCDIAGGITPVIVTMPVTVAPSGPIPEMGIPNMADCLRDDLATCLQGRHGRTWRAGVMSSHDSWTTVAVSV